MKSACKAWTILENGNIFGNNPKLQFNFLGITFHDRCRYKGSTGMKRWVGLGLVADNLINIGRVMEKQSRQR